MKKKGLQSQKKKVQPKQNKTVISNKSMKYRPVKLIQPAMRFSPASERELNKHYEKYNESPKPTNMYDSDSSYTVYEYEEDSEEYDKSVQLNIAKSIAESLPGSQYNKKYDSQLIGLSTIPTETYTSLEPSQIMQAGNFSMPPIDFGRRFTIFHELKRLDMTRRRIFLQIFFNLWKKRFRNRNFDVLIEPDYIQKTNTLISSIPDSFVKKTIKSNFSNVILDNELSQTLNNFRQMKQKIELGKSNLKSPHPKQEYSYEFT
ncbi:hypothetical protein TRFO_03001 [Tritrichomonas foetus]|uniref:Uncharacterized protein n=1 Tax=Tritrichomonas foetus TaxID=1144522 RepID=A0A1J4KTZ9_9EUKA|nr:hypothetical protein TRFO_03001 [Tritrichomonas foetus]|eukprot:OHT14739.1 hypothetical protein TRFO_03001 [Tritrichomonas foetus]